MMRPQDTLVNITEWYITLKVSDVTQPVYFAYIFHGSGKQRGCSRHTMSGPQLGKFKGWQWLWQLGAEIIWKRLHSYVWMLMLVVIKKDKKDPGQSAICRTHRRMAERAKREPRISLLEAPGGGGLIGWMIKSRLKMVLTRYTPMPKPCRWTFLLRFLGLPPFLRSTWWWPPSQAGWGLDAWSFLNTWGNTYKYVTRSKYIMTGRNLGNYLS